MPIIEKQSASKPLTTERHTDMNTDEAGDFDTPRIRELIQEAIVKLYRARNLTTNEQKYAELTTAIKSIESALT